MEEMKQFIEYVARSLVEHPDEVEVSQSEGNVSQANGEGENSVVIELRCNSADAGQLIGRGGRTIKALRTLLVTAAAKHGVRAGLEIIE